MKLQRYIVEAELNGKPIRKLWRADHPLKIGYPEVWTLERTEGGIKVTKYDERQPARPGEERAPLFEHELEMTRDTLVRPFVVKADQHTRIQKLSILPAHGLTPVFHGRAPGERTRHALETGEGLRDARLEGEEFFVFTCFGNWVASSEVLETGLMRPEWFGYFAGRQAFKVKRQGGKYVVRCLVPQLDLKFLEHRYGMTKDQMLELSPEQLNQLEIKLGEATWYFRKIAKAGQLPPEFVPVDEAAQLLRKIGVRVGLAFAALLALTLVLPKPKPVERPVPPVEIEIQRETIVVPKEPEPVKAEEPPPPEPEPQPEPEPVKAEPPKPKPEPPKPKPAPVPPPRAEAPRPAAAPPPRAEARQPEPARPAPSAPAPAAPAPPAPAAITPVTNAPPPPSAAQLQQAEVSKALSFLGSSNRAQVKIPTGAQYAKPGEGFKPGVIAQGALTQSSQIGALAQSNVPTGPITTSGSRSISGAVVKPGAKGLNDVQGRVGTGAVYRGAASLGGAGSPGMSVGGQGQLDPEAIRKVLNANLARIQYCYEKTLLVNPNAAGGMTLGWQIQPDGTVAGVRIIKSAISDAAMQGCVSQNIRGLRFPRPQGGAVLVDYPFNFSSSSL